MKKILIIFIVLFFSNITNAETIIQLHTFSYHINRTTDYNESNFGLGIKHYVKTDEYISLGFYKNSEYDTSKYVGFGYNVYKSDISVNISYGIVMGYKSNNVLPYIIPVIKYKKVSLSFLLLPSPVVALSFDILEF